MILVANVTFNVLWPAPRSEARHLLSDQNVCLSVCPTVTLVSHAQMVQYQTTP